MNTAKNATINTGMSNMISILKTLWTKNRLKPSTTKTENTRYKITREEWSKFYRVYSPDHNNPYYPWNYEESFRSLRRARRWVRKKLNKKIPSAHEEYWP